MQQASKQPKTCTLRIATKPSMFVPTRKDGGFGEFSAREITVRNSSRRKLAWMDNLGMTVVESPSLVRSDEEGLHFTLRYTYERSSRAYTSRFRDELIGLIDRAEQTQMKDGLALIDHSVINKNSFYLTFSCTTKDIEDCGGVAYFREVDVVVGFEEHIADVIHPRFIDGQLLMLNEATEKYSGYQHRILIVDNTNAYGERWVNTGIDTILLHPKNDINLEDGVYVTTINGSTKNPETRRYSFEDADKLLGLYTTRNDAEVFGSPKTQFESEKVELERQLVQDKAELQRLLHEVAMEKAANERKRTAMDLDYENQKLELKRLNDELDRRRNEHKVDMDTRRDKLKQEEDDHKARMRRDEERIKQESDKLRAEEENIRHRRRIELENLDYERKHTDARYKENVDKSKNVMIILTAWSQVLAPFIGAFISSLLNRGSRK